MIGREGRYEGGREGGREIEGEIRRGREGKKEGGGKGRDKENGREVLHSVMIKLCVISLCSVLETLTMRSVSVCCSLSQVPVGCQLAGLGS